MERFSYNELIVLDFQYDIMPNYWGFFIIALFCQLHCTYGCLQICAKFNTENDNARGVRTWKTRLGNSHCLLCAHYMTIAEISLCLSLLPICLAVLRRHFTWNVEKPWLTCNQLLWQLVYICECFAYYISHTGSIIMFFMPNSWSNEILWAKFNLDKAKIHLIKTLDKALNKSF